MVVEMFQQVMTENVFDDRTENRGQRNRTVVFWCVAVSFLKHGAMFAFSQSFGRIPVSKEHCNMAGVSSVAHSFKTRCAIPSGTGDLAGCELVVGWCHLHV